MMGKKSKLNITYVRRFTQIFFILFIMYGGLIGVPKLFVKNENLISQEDISAGNLNENLVKDPRLNAYLPIRSCKNTLPDTGVFQGCGLYLLSNTITYRTFLSSAFAIVILFALIFLFGRVWCGWACPIGFIEEMLDAIRGFFKINYIKLSSRLNRILRKIRYTWLLIIFLVSFSIAIPVFGSIRKDLFNINCLTCPARIILMAFPKFSPTYLSFETFYYAVGSIILIIFLGIVALGFFVRRFWCRLCPNGALLALFNKGCLTTKEKDINKCTKCGICYDICPVDNEDVYQIKDRKVVNSDNCIMCFECVDKCPENDCLKVKFIGKTIFRSKFKE